MKRKTLLRSGLALTALCALTLTTGCRSTESMKTDTGSICPQCGNPTVSTPIEEVACNCQICTVCKKAVTDESEMSAAMANYTSRGLHTVQVCRNCDAAVIPCAHCSAMK
jgi:hypothetical protein